MADGQYTKAPIVEAVVEFRFQKEVDIPDLEAPSRHPDREYVNSKKMFRVGTHLTLDAQNSQARVEQQEMGWEFRTAAGDVVLIVDREKVLFSQLAPYPGWNTFLSRIERDWEWARNVVGIHPMNRAAIRTINRLDVPSTLYQPANYISVLPSVPADIGDTLEAFTQQVELSLTPNGHRKVRINSGSISEMVVPNHSSILLDIDVWDQSVMPIKLDDTWQLLGELRNLKNDIFEKCITEAARELFK